MKFVSEGEMDYRIADFYEAMLLGGCDWYKCSPADNWTVYIKIKYGTSLKAKSLKLGYSLLYGELFGKGNNI